MALFKHYIMDIPSGQPEIMLLSAVHPSLNGNITTSSSSFANNIDHVKQQQTSTPPPAPPTIRKKKNADAIVYLAQFGHHSSYGTQFDANENVITGLSKLNKSLELLYANYVREFPTADVLIFYDVANAPDNATMEVLRQGNNNNNHRPNLQFRRLDEKKWWHLPHGLQSWEYVTWKRPAFSVGYRLMMRWYAILIWFYLDAEGYTHVMRLDDDSYILSKIDYNLFDYMRDNNKKYAFRQPVYESGGDEFDALMDAYFLSDNPNNATSRASMDLYKQDRGVGFYNNFFVADVKFFMSPPAATLLSIIDESKMIFTQRLGDLVVQSTVVRLLLKPDEVHWFQDFTYEHMTLCRKEKCGLMVYKGCPQNGGVSRGIGVYTDAEWRNYAMEEVQNRFEDNPKKCSVPINRHFVGAEDVRTCSRLHSRCGFYLKLVSGVNDTAEDNSNSLNHHLLENGEIIGNKTY